MVDNEDGRKVQTPDADTDEGDREDGNAGLRELLSRYSKRQGKKVEEVVTKTTPPKSKKRGKANPGAAAAMYQERR